MRTKKKIQLFIYTDSNSSITIASKRFYLTSKNALENDSDIKCEVRKFYSMCKTFVSIQFVRSHQDDGKPFKQLSLASKLNVLMDKFAKEALQPNSKPSIRHKQMIPHLPEQKISFHNNHHRLTRETLKNLNRYNVGHQAESYIQRRRGITNEQMKMINWSDIERVIGETSVTKRTQYIKIFHHSWPTMSRNYKWKQSDTDKCPLCCKVRETVEHVFKCEDPRAKTYQSLQVLDLTKKLRGISTDPFITNTIARMIYQFTSNFPVTTLPTPRTASDKQKIRIEKMNNQVQLGTHLLLSGFLTKDVSDIQQEYLCDLRRSKKPNVRSWNRSAIKLLSRIMEEPIQHPP